jgi:hypothetical protein
MPCGHPVRLIGALDQLADEVGAIAMVVVERIFLTELVHNHVVLELYLLIKEQSKEVAAELGVIGIDAQDVGDFIEVGLAAVAKDCRWIGPHSSASRP